MRIAILGRTEALFDTACMLRERAYEIGAFVTAKAAPEYTRNEEDFEQLADVWSVPFRYDARLGRSESVGFLKRHGPFDVGVSVNYPNLIPQEVIDLFRLGILNAHCGDLPRYRGNACPAWAILNGEERVGLCIHKMIGDQLDSGDIVARDYSPLAADTYIGHVLAWMTSRIPQLFLEAVERLRDDPEFVLEVQSTNPKDSLRCYPRHPSDGRIDWSSSVDAIQRLVRASAEPFAGAHTTFRGAPLIIWRAGNHVDGERYAAVPGQVAAIDRVTGDVVVIAGDGKLRMSCVSSGEERRVKPAQIITSLRARLGG